MRAINFKLLVAWTVVCWVTVGTGLADPHFMIDDYNQWSQSLYGGSMDNRIEAMTYMEWYDYMYHWWYNPNVTREGEPYPSNEFRPPELYVWHGGGTWTDPNGNVYEYPEEAGLVMAWDGGGMDGNYSSAWKFIYGEDPDLYRSLIRISVRPSRPGINAVSFAMVDSSGRIRSWWWNVPGTLPRLLTTTVSIDASKTGQNATTPRADGYASDDGFDIRNVVAFTVDENGEYRFGELLVPPPGQLSNKIWNYWGKLLVIPNPGEGKNYVKWSQPPVLYEPNGPAIFYGWDEMANYQFRPILADDWLCKDERPITDIHWWGSYIGWDQPYPPPVVPKMFHIGIWTDVPDPDPCNPFDFSHPGRLLWENFCDNWVWNFAGYDRFPDWNQSFDHEETCFQFNQLLSQNEWFYQDPNDMNDGDPNQSIYWLSIAPIYDSNITMPQYPWGWKTRPHFFNNDAVRIWDATLWPPIKGALYTGGVPIIDPCGISWDLAFELTTNMPAYEDDPIPGDLNGDKIVNFYDVAILANNWLVAAP